MAIQGLRTTANFVTDQRPKNWNETVMLLYPNGKTPLTALTSVMKSASTDDPEYNWWEKELNGRRVELSANLTTSNTTISCKSGAQALKAGDLLYVEHTGEIIRVNGDPSADTSFTAVRGYSGTTAAAVDFDGAGVNPNMTVIGSAYEEGSDAPTGVNFDPTKRKNYTQIFRNTLEATRTAAKTRLRTGDQVKEAKRECLELHSIDKEMAFWLGQRWEGTRNGKPIRTTGGITSFIPTANTYDATGMTDYNSGVTMDQIDEMMYLIFQYGASEKMAYLGNRAALTIQQAVRKNSSMQIQSGIKEYGMNVTRITSPFGELVLKTHPLFNTRAGGTNDGDNAYYGMESWMAVLDMENIKYRYFSGDDTRYEKDLQANGVDGQKSGYLTECGLEVHHPKTHLLFKNLHTAAVDA